MTAPGGVETSRVAALLLAAGGSRRLGQPKQLVTFRGEPLIVRAAAMLESACPGAVHVVLGARARLCREALAGYEVRCHVCREWREGMGASLAFGTRAVIAGQPDAAGLLIMHVDQYRLTAKDLSLLLTAWLAAPGRIAAAARDGQVGPPVIIPSAFFSILTSLEGERGAKGLLLEQDCQRIPMPASGFDLDTPADLEKLHALEGSQA